MLKVNKMTPNQVKISGLHAIRAQMGIVGLIRFIQQYEIGYGDYTADRYEWQKNYNVQKIVNEIKNKKQ